MPTISIIIPTYNVARFLPMTLDSILAQTFTDWECILVDDGSGDDTAAIAQSYAARDSRFRALRQDNAGPSVARNFGYSRADPTSRFVTFMDSDDLWIPEALQLLQDELERDPQAVAASGLADFIDADGAPLRPGEFAASGRSRRETRGRRRVYLKPHEPTTFAGLCIDNVLFPPGLWLARRSAYDQTDGFDPAQKAAEDWGVLIALSRCGPIRFVDRIILFYRRHENNLGATAVTPKMAFLVRCRTFYSPKNTPEQQRILRNGERAYQREMVGERVRVGVEKMRRRQFAGAAASFARVPVHFWRWYRGAPSIKSLPPELRQFVGR